jgi:hypothetical protein
MDVFPAVTAALTLLNSIVQYQTVRLQRASPETAAQLAQQDADERQRLFDFWEPLFTLAKKLKEPQP